MLFGGGGGANWITQLVKVQPLKPEVVVRVEQFSYPIRTQATICITLLEIRFFGHPPRVVAYRYGVKPGSHRLNKVKSSKSSSLIVKSKRAFDCVGKSFIRFAIASLSKMQI